MRKLITTAIAVAIGWGVTAATSQAADVAPRAVVTKAAPIPFSAPGGLGAYLGGGFEGGVAASSVNGTSFPNLTGGGLNAAGAAVVVDWGYIWSNCILSTWCQVELDAKYQNINGSTTGGGASVSSQWAFSQEFDIGADAIATLTSVLPNLNTSFPTFNPSGLLPANIAVATTPRGYVGFKSEFFKENGQFGGATGETWGWAPGVTGGYRWQTLGSNGQPNGGSLKAYADILWANRGITLENLFSAGGAPKVVNGSASMNTFYMAGLHYDFPVKF